MTLCYFAHPLGGDVDGNAARALRWLSWLYDVEPDVTIIAPWLVGVQLFRLRYPAGIDDKGHPFRTRCMRDNLRTVQSCNGIVLCGGAISPGMADELEMITERPAPGWISDLTSLGPEPPPAHEAWGTDHAPPLAWGCSRWQDRIDAIRGRAP